VGRTRTVAGTFSALGAAAMLWAVAPLPVSAGMLVPTPGEPTTSTGDIRFSASAIAFRHGPKEARAEFLLRVPYPEIHFELNDSIYEGRLRISAELLGGRDMNRRVAYRQEEARVQSTDAAATIDSTLGEIYTFGLVGPPGVYRYRVTVEDMSVAKRGILYQLQKRRKEGRVEGQIDLSDWLFRQPALSGIEFAWALGPRRGDSPFVRGPYDVAPNPAAHYGLFVDSVSLYFEIYGATPPVEGRSFRVRNTIWSEAGDTLHCSVDSLRATEGTAWPYAMSFDVASYPRGQYQLRLDILGPGEKPVASTQSSFDVLWSPESWIPDAADYYEVAASTLLDGDDAKHFRTLSRGEKEALLEDLWRKLDPTPETAENEVRELFRRRVAYANAHFTVFTRGMFTDRGRIWIRYGEPDEIKVERMPTIDRSTLGRQLGDLPATARDALTRNDSGAADFRPYEIWTYQFRGQELSPGHRLSEISSGMKFVFVDEQGYGEYLLRYSSTTAH
jgi:GWxTD domain-containing protein